MKRNFLDYVKILLLVFAIIIVFAGVDFIFHSLSPEYSVPPRYFPNKIIYGTLIGFVICLFFEKVKYPINKALIFSTIISVSLQIRYYFEGYPLDFVVLFLFIHFFILLILSYLAFRFLRNFVKI